MIGEHNQNDVVDRLVDCLLEELGKSNLYASATKVCKELCDRNERPDLLDQVLVKTMLDEWMDSHEGGRDPSAEELCQRFGCLYLVDKLAGEIMQQIEGDKICSFARSGPPSNTMSQPRPDAQTASKPRLLAGQVLAGRYRVDELIAVGESAQVWKGCDLNAAASAGLPRSVVIVVPNADQEGKLIPKPILDAFTIQADFKERGRQYDEEDYENMWASFSAVWDVKLIQEAFIIGRSEHLNTVPPIGEEQALRGLPPFSDYGQEADFYFVVFDLATPMRLLDRRYELEKRVSDGGHAVVWKGIDQKEGTDGREVAIKMPRPDLVESVDQFLAEARTVKNLKNHPNVVPIYEFGRVRDSCYLVFPFMEGGSLFDLIDRGPVPPADAARIVAQVAEGLAHAHKLGRLHRDIHPGNILFDHLGTPKLSDFGISTSTGKSGGSRRCNPAYMSPEEADSRDVDEGSDLYSLGVCLYVMLTGGKLPYAHTDDANVLRQQIIAGNLTLEFAGHIPAVLRRICGSLLSKWRDHRYQSAAKLAVELQRVKAGLDALSVANMLFKEANEEEYKLSVAELEYNQAVRLLPSCADGYKQRGICKFKQGKVEESFADFVLAQSFAPEDVEVYELLVLADKSLGRLDEAIDDLEAALKLSPPDPAPIHDHLVFLYAKLAGRIWDDIADAQICALQLSEAISHARRGKRYVNREGFEKGVFNFENAYAAYKEANRVFANNEFSDTILETVALLAVPWPK